MKRPNDLQVYLWIAAAVVYGGIFYLLYLLSLVMQVGVKAVGLAV